MASCRARGIRVASRARACLARAQNNEIASAAKARYFLVFRAREGTGARCYSYASGSAVHVGARAQHVTHLGAHAPHPMGHAEMGWQPGAQQVCIGGLCGSSVPRTASPGVLVQWSVKGDLVDEIHTRTESQRFGERRALMVRTRP